MFVPKVSRSAGLKGWALRVFYIWKYKYITQKITITYLEVNLLISVVRSFLDRCPVTISLFSFNETTASNNPFDERWSFTRKGVKRLSTVGYVSRDVIMLTRWSRKRNVHVSVAQLHVASVFTKRRKGERRSVGDGRSKVSWFVVRRMLAHRWQWFLLRMGVEVNRRRKEGSFNASPLWNI